MSDDSQTTVSEVVHSPALYLGKVRVEEQRGGGSRGFLSGRRIKNALFPMMHWVLRRAPLWLALLPMRLLVGLARLLYWLPGNALRSSCEYICKLAARAGYEHEPAVVYRQLLENMLVTFSGYFRLYREGVTPLLEMIDIAPAERERVNRILSEHGGAVLMAPHNVASAFSGFKLNHEFPTLIVAKNSSTIQRTKLALDMFEQMQVKVLMVRGGNPFELSRTMFSVLRKGMLVAATVDNRDDGEGSATIQMFGQDIGVSAWAARIAARMKVPVLPAYFESVGDRVRIDFGEPLITDKTEEAVQHYMGYFEQNILREPSSWVYLADKKWRRVLLSATDNSR